MFNVDAGYAHAFAQAPERSAATVNAKIGLGTGNDNGGFGFGCAVRTKWSDNVQQFSFAPLMYGVLGSDSKHEDIPDVAAFIVGGFDLFTIEGVAKQFEASLGSPFIEIGGFFHVYDIWGITAAVSFEDDLRFDATPNTGYVSFLLGWGAVTYASARRIF